MGGSRRGGGLRIVAGRFRGRRLETPSGREVRPTADRVREALFSILAPRLEGARVVDCFAGTGALGIEALSRGAARVVFVENDPESLAVLRRNLALVGGGEDAVVRARDALAASTWEEEREPAEIILADPPYRRGLGGALMEVLAGRGAVAVDGLLVIEHEAGEEPSHAAWIPLRRNRYGDSVLSFFHPSGGGEGAAG